MSTAPLIPAITLIVGQQVEISLTVTGAGSGTIWLSCDNPPVISPLALGGTPAIWPAEVALTADSGIFSIEGTALGAAMISFLDEIDPPDPETSGSNIGSMEVFVVTAEEYASGDVGGSNELLSIPEQFIILIAPLPPAGGPM